MRDIITVDLLVERLATYSRLWIAWLMLQPVVLLSSDDYQHDSRQHEAPRAAL